MIRIENGWCETSRRKAEVHLLGGPDENAFKMEWYKINAGCPFKSECQIEMLCSLPGSRLSRECHGWLSEVSVTEQRPVTVNQTSWNQTCSPNQKDLLYLQSSWRNLRICSLQKCRGKLQGPRRGNLWTKLILMTFLLTFLLIGVVKWTGPAPLHLVKLPVG